jgi:RNA polymerase sigma-70 factor (ECF subfamily)
MYNYTYIASLVRRVQKNDAQAFTELYTLTYEKQYTYAYHYLKDSFLAEDAVQEVYVIAHSNISKLKNPVLFIAWIKKINFHVCFDIAKKHNFEQLELNNEFLYTELASSDPESLAVSADYSSFLKKEIKKLPYKECQVIVMRYFYNMKIDEIVKATSYSKSSVKRYINSGKKHLAIALKN